MTRVVGETQDGKNKLVEVKKIELRIGAYGILLNGDSVMVTQTYLPLWEFPGGGVEPGEKLLLALKREFKEETGIDVEVEKFILERESFYLSPTGKVFHSFQNFFLVKKGGRKTIKNLLNSQARWVSLTALSQKNMKKSAFDALKVFLKKEKAGNFQGALVGKNAARY